MIGLGSNRLTVCRRGGMSVTQAGKGGMEWLAGGRGPSWSSPYSAQATAALKAQFPTQWPTIRDYGFAHPEYINTLNWAVLEDINIMYSLIPELGITRKLVASGNAYVLTNYYPNLESKITIDIIEANVNATSWGVSSVFYCFHNTLAIYWGFDSKNGSINQNIKNQRHLIEMDKTGVKIDGTEKAQITGATSFTAAYPMALFARTDNATGEVKSFGYPTIITAKIQEVGRNVRMWIPFKRNNAAECLDLVTGRVETKSGSFTISETPAS